MLETVHRAIESGKVLACHDVSEGGVIAAVAEMCFGGDCGAQLWRQPMTMTPDTFLFNETAGCFVVEVENFEIGKDIFRGLPHIFLGKTTGEKNITAQNRFGEQLFKVTTDELKEAWQAPLRRIFP